MTETRVVGQSVVLRSPAECAGVVEEFEQSGKRRKEFYGERGIAIQTLGYHLHKLHKRQARVLRLLPVEFVSSLANDSKLRVQLANGRRIAVEAGFDAGLLRRLVAVLEE